EIAHGAWLSYKIRPPPTSVSIDHDNSVYDGLRPRARNRPGAEERKQRLGLEFRWRVDLAESTTKCPASSSGTPWAHRSPCRRFIDGPGRAGRRGRIDLRLPHIYQTRDILPAAVSGARTALRGRGRGSSASSSRWRPSARGGLLRAEERADPKVDHGDEPG